MQAVKYYQKEALQEALVPHCSRVCSRRIIRKIRLLIYGSTAVVSPLSVGLKRRTF